MKRLIKASNNQTKKYLIYINNNESAADRDSSVRNTHDIIPVEAKNYEEAYRYAMLYVTDLADFEELEEEYPNTDPLSFLNDQDITSGTPFVYGIKESGEGLIFDFDFGRWYNEYYNPDSDIDNTFNDNNSDIDYIEFYYDDDKDKFIGMGEVVLGEGNTLKEAIENAKKDASDYNKIDYNGVYFDESSMNSHINDSNEDLTQFTEPGDLGEIKVYWRYND